MFDSNVKNAQEIIDEPINTPITIFSQSETLFSSLSVRLFKVVESDVAVASGIKSRIIFALSSASFTIMSACPFSSLKSFSASWILKLGDNEL